MWTYLQADNKVYDGNNAAILSLRRNPPGVVAQGGTATFDTANVGTGKTVTYNSYSLGGADSGLYALFAPFSYVTAAASTPGSGTTLANITPAPLAIKANDASKTEGDTLVIPSSAFTSSGLVNGETVGSATLTSLGTAASASATGSPYLINASNATAGTFNPANYTITYAPGNLLIAARPATTPPATTPPVTTVPGSTSPGTTPGTTVPGTTPDTTSPATTVPDTTLPVTTVPGATPPVNTLPGGTTPVSTPVGSTAPNPSATDSTLPSSGIPGLAVAATLPGVPVDQYLGAKTPDIGNTGNPNDPGNPANPGNPGNPSNPGSPGNPAQPGNPSEGRAPHNGRAYIPSLAALTVVGAGINMPASQLAQVTPVLPIQVKDSLGDPAKANTQQIPYPYKAPVYLPRQERN
ncbi:YDG domain-containing protein [Pseudomonas congelans]|nr:YDG domain-containing protein [Pseudomonas congelans]